MKPKQMQIADCDKLGWHRVMKLAYSGNVKKHASHRPIPIMVTRFGKPYVIIQRFTEDVQKLEELRTGKITWEDFKEEMLQRGYQQMMSGETKVKPGDIVGAERVEVERQRAKVETAAFMLDAAKYFSGKLYVCGNCGHTMLPASPEEENKYLDEPGNSTSTP